MPNGQVGQPTTIVVQGRYQFGNARSTGGGSVSYLVTGSNFQSGGFTDNGDGTYTASYTPTNTGSDSVAILINLQAIQGSPFTSSIP